MYWNQLQNLSGLTGYDSQTSDRAQFADGLLAVDQFNQRYPGKPGLCENVLGEPQNLEGDNPTAQGKDAEVLERNDGLTGMV
jgi:hypothetical protein